MAIKLNTKLHTYDFVVSYNLVGLETKKKYFQWT
jgi:hypothetical protein